MLNFDRFGLTLVLFLLHSNFGYAAEREHEAHEHGVAELNIVLDQSVIVIQLLSPAVNLVGFEHAPRDDEQKLLIENTLVTLNQGDKLFEFPSSAGCQLESADVQSSLDNDHEEHGEHDHEDELADSHSDNEEDTHSEFEANYEFECKDLASINQIDTTLFELFPLTEEIAVQLISPDVQTTTSLAPGSAIIRF